MNQLKTAWTRLSFKLWAFRYAVSKGYENLNDLKHNAGAEDWRLFVDAARVRRGW